MPPVPVRALRAVPVLALLLALGGCGLAQSIAQGYAGTQSVTIEARVDRTGTILRSPDGSDLEVQPGATWAGDTAVGAWGLCVFGFPIDASRQPSHTRLERATLWVWVEPTSGAPQDLAPLVVSHLPGQPDAPLAPGQVPDPPGEEVATVEDVVTAGWRRVEVTPYLLQDWNGGRTLSAFAVRLSAATNGDGQSDTVTLQGSNDGSATLALLVLDFTVDV
jgi:hypothetical protein